MKKIKTALVVLACVLPSVSTIHAQDYKRHSFGVSFGAGESAEDNNRIRAINDYYTSKYRIVGNSLDSDELFRTHLNLSLDYYYRLHQLWRVGITLGYCWASENYEYDYRQANTNPQEERLRIAEGGTELNNTKCGRFSDRVFYVMPSLKFFFPFSKNWNARLYARASAGIMLQHLSFDYSMRIIDYDPKSIPFGEVADNPFPVKTEQTDDNRWRFAYQVMPVGVDIPFGRFAVFAEVGYGYQGTILTGMRYEL